MSPSTDPYPLREPAPPSSPAPEPGAIAIAAAIDLLPLGAVLLDEWHRVAHANPAFAAVTREPSASALGRNLFQSVLPALGRDPAAARLVEPAGGSVDGVSEPVTLPGPAGARHFRFHFRQLRVESGAWTLVLAEDCTEAVQERERRVRAERLAAVGELAAGVAHEVNNPLASIKSFAQLMVRDATDGGQREALELIINESTRVAEIVDKLLSFARQQGASGRTPVNLSTVAERVLHMQRYALETAGIKVRRDFDAALSPVMGEVGALQQVVLNMVVNAEQALSAKAGERLLIVRTRESTEGVILAVVDNGPGIPRELLPQIFERFRTTKPGGTGLGLAISAAIVRDHSGQVWAESDEGRGTAFYVRLPRATPAVPATVAAPPIVQPPVPTADPLRRPLRVLVADDEPALRLAISMFLSRRGHTVIQAPDAYEALRLAESQPFDVALVDARMPGDGLVLLEQLEQLPALRGRTALMTGDIGRPRTQQGIATGRPCLTKPFDMDEMIRLLETLGG